MRVIERKIALRALFRYYKEQKRGTNKVVKLRGFIENFLAYLVIHYRPQGQ